MARKDILPPEVIKKGDSVMLVATARKVTPQEMAPAIALLEHWGLRVKENPLLYAADHQMAGTDAQRAAQLQQALDDEEVRAVFCVRGGYGTVRIVDRIDWSRLAQQPKWIVGYSDVTVLHSHIARRLGLPTLHAIMPVNVPADAVRAPYPALESLHQALFEGSLRYGDIVSPTAQPPRPFRPGQATAPVTGGNLSILYSLCGSPSDIDTRGKILFIEDLDEYLYHIDRMMQNLKRTGKLDHLAGLVVGALCDMHDNGIPFGRTAEEIVWDAVKDYDYPVAMHCRMGHIGTDNLALPLGREARLTVSPQGTASLHFPAGEPPRPPRSISTHS